MQKEWSRGCIDWGYSTEGGRQRQTYHAWLKHKDFEAKLPTITLLGECDPDAPLVPNPWSDELV